MCVGIGKELILSFAQIKMFHDLQSMQVAGFDVPSCVPLHSIREAGTSQLRSSSDLTLSKPKSKTREAVILPYVCSFLLVVAVDVKTHKPSLKF
jgi:hypothetical protein